MERIARESREEGRKEILRAARSRFGINIEEGVLGGQGQREGGDGHQESHDGLRREGAEGARPPAETPPPWLCRRSRPNRPQRRNYRRGRTPIRVLVQRLNAMEGRQS